MVKLKNPLFSLGAVGRLTKAITFTRRRKTDIAEKTPDLVDVKSYRQLTWRTMFLMARDLWHALSAAEKIAWEAAGTTRHMTGYAYFISQALRPNPGLYLPLLGGTMQGDIGMAGFKIEGLPDPAAAQEADTLAARDTAIAFHAALAAVHHARYSDGEAVSAMGAKADGNPLHHDRATEWGATEHTAVGNGSPHHARYSDGEAVSAMGAKADGNPLNHDRAAEWGATEHTAVGNGAPHHTKYTDANVLAVAAALFHASRHIPGGADPMRWAANKLLKGAGSGADPTLVDAPPNQRIKLETRAMNAASGNVSYTGYGFTPTSLVIIGVSGIYFSFSLIIPDGTGLCWKRSYSSTALTPQTSFAVWINPASGVSQISTWVSYDADGFTLNWVKGGAPTGTLTFIVIASG